MASKLGFRTLSVFVWLLALLSSCFGRLKPCSSDADCPGGYCHPGDGICVEQPSGVGGMAGGGAGGGGADLCLEVFCDVALQCDKGQCLPRYSGLTLAAPARTRGGTVNVSAVLALAPNRSRFDPPGINLRIVAPGGGSVLVGLPLVDAGFYAYGIDVAAEGHWRLEASLDTYGLSSAATTVVDRTAPNYRLVLPPAPPRTDNAIVTEVDLAAPGSWRRDETAKVRLISNDLDVLASSVVVRLAVADGGAASFDGGAPCDAGPFCWEVTVDFAAPEMNAFRARAGVSATAADDLGNAGATVDGGQALVTRFKWSRPLPPGAAPVPSLDEFGNIFLGHPPSGSKLSFTPEGLDRWALIDGFAANPPALGRSIGGAPPLLWLSEQTRLRAYTSDSPGVPTGWSNAGPTSSNATLPALGLSATSGDPVSRETAFVILKNPDTVFAYRVDAPNPVHASTGRVVSMTHPVIAQGKLWVRDNDGTQGKLTAYVLADAGFTVGVPSIASPASASEWLAVTSNALLQVTNELKAFSLADGGVQWTSVLPPGSAFSLSAPVIGAGDTVFVAQTLNSTDWRLCRGTISGLPGWQCTAQDVSEAPATLGQGGLLYHSALSGLQVRRQSDLQVQWAAPPEISSFFSVLDCSRRPFGVPLPGRPGVLYVAPAPAAVSRFTAIIVDSRGLDATAPWPLFRHDPRQTANASSALDVFSCP